MRKIIVFAVAALIVGALAAGDLYACGASKAKSCGGAKATIKECAKLCKKDGKCEFTTISVKGMTCGGCEKSVTAALSKIDGVLKVVNVSHKDGVAEICYDPGKTSGDALAKVISKEGYQAEVAQAVATGGETKRCCRAAGNVNCCMAGKAKAEGTSEGPN